MATSDSSDTGIGIKRNSLSISLEQRYGSWKNDFERQAPRAVDFLNNDYAEGFVMNKSAGGVSDIRNIALGGSGADFKYGNEHRIPKLNSDSITTTYGAGDSNSIQKEFQAKPTVRVTRFQPSGLNYVDRIPGFDNKKYWTGGF